MKAGEEDTESVARCQKGIELVQQGIIPANVIIPLTAGYGKEDPANPWRLSPGSSTPQRGESLAEQQAAFLRKQAGLEKAIIIEQPLIWGTGNEIRESIRIIAELGYERAHFSFVATAGGQLWRSRLVWSAIYPKGWTADFYGVLIPLPFARKRHELASLLKYCVMFKAPAFFRPRPEVKDYVKKKT